MTSKIIRKSVRPGRTIDDGYGRPIQNYSRGRKALLEIMSDEGQHLCFRWEDPKRVRKHLDIFGGK